MDDPDEILDDVDGPHIVMWVLVALLFAGALCVGLELAGVLAPGSTPVVGVRGTDTGP